MTRARLVRYGLITAIVASLLFVAMRPSPRRVDTAMLGVGAVVSTIEAEGRTRVRDRYVVTAPIAAQVRRVELQPGDAVARGDIVAVLDPLSPAALDPRSLSEARSRAAAAESRRQAASEELQSAQALAAQATADAERLAAVAARGLLPADQAERAETDRRRALRDVASARFRLATAAHEQDAAQAALEFGSDARPARSALELRAPVDGTVLRRHVESSTSVQPGTPLLEIGDLQALEVEVDVLSADAVQLRPGMPVELLRWGEPMPLEGSVHRVEPAAFTRVSALGVEEQRVWVIVELRSPPERWVSLGDAYRVDARFVLDRRDDALRLPSSALFRAADDWAVFRVEDDRARQVAVDVGLRGGLWVEVLDGLADGDAIVVHPDRELGDGDQVQPR